MKALKEILRLLLFGVKFCVAMLAVIFLFGEEAPDAHFSFLAFIGIKAAAAGVIYLLYKDFLFCGRHNLLPFFCKDDYKELINPDSDADLV